MIFGRFKSSFGSESGSGSITSSYGSGSWKKFRILADRIRIWIWIHNTGADIALKFILACTDTVQIHFVIMMKVGRLMAKLLLSQSTVLRLRLSASSQFYKKAMYS
jgi:CRISPR/Cas system-associated endonuclease/helicase Cas3